MLSECGDQDEILNRSMHSQAGAWERGKTFIILFHATILSEIITNLI